MNVLSQNRPDLGNDAALGDRVPEASSRWHLPVVVHGIRTGRFLQGVLQNEPVPRVRGWPVDPLSA